MVGDRRGEVHLDFHEHAHVRWGGVGEEGGVAHHPGREGRLSERLNLFFTDATSSAKGTQTDEAIPITLANAGASIEAGVGVADRPLTQRPCEPCGTAAEPGGAAGVLVADAPVVARLLAADGAVALDDVLAGDGSSEELDLFVTDSEGLDAASEARSRYYHVSVSGGSSKSVR